MFLHTKREIYMRIRKLQWFIMFVLDPLGIRETDFQHIQSR
jgi:hypothetical protein